MTTFNFTEVDSITGLECLTVWPDQSCRAEIYSNNIKIAFKPNTKRRNAQHLKLHVKSSEAKEYTIIHLPKWAYKVLTTYFHNSYQVFRVAWPFGKFTTSKVLSLINIHGGVLVCNNTANFYCCFAINNFLRELKKARQNGIRSTEQYMSLCSHEINLDRIFECQYNDRQTLRSYVHSDDTSVTNEYVLAPRYVTDTIDLQERQIEYNKFIDNELSKTYPEKNDGSLQYIKGIFVKNKVFIRDYNNLKKSLTNAITLTEKHKTPLLTEDMISHLQQMIRQLENQAATYKCCVCFENWKDCLLPNCMHMDMCRSCLLKNRNYSYYTCPFCRCISSFYIVDFDIATS